MPTQHTIQQGESIVDIAFQYGFYAETIWNDDANAALREKRSDMNILMPGDVLTIPDVSPKEVPAATTKRHRFRVKGVPAVFRMQVFDLDEPRRDQSYELVIRGPFGEQKLRGTTDGDGVLQEYVPVNARSGTLTIGPEAFTIEVGFGMLDPINELSGVQKRLQNLGFDCEPTGEMDEETRLALAAFQRRFALTVTGEADEATVAQLEGVNDEVNAYPDEPPPEP